MFVATTMTHNPVTVYPETSLAEARSLMQREKIHRLPVVDHHGRLCGIVSEKDILGVMPSPASTLDRYEISNLLDGLKIEGIMKREVVTVTEDTPVEEAARLMADHDIGGLPVLRDQKTLVGIITESDLFRLFVDMFGARKPGLRLTLQLPQKEGELAAISTAIAGKGGNIIAIGSAPGSDPTNITCVVKVEGVSADTLKTALGPLVIRIVDIREL